MSSVGSSFVNKSGRSFAPTKAVRRRPRQASPPKDALKPAEPPKEDVPPAESEATRPSEPQSSAPEQNEDSTQADEPPAAVSAQTAHAELQVVQSTEQDGTVVIETDAPVAVAEEIVGALEPALKRRKIQTQSPAPRISVSRQTRSVSRPASIASQSEVHVNVEPKTASPRASVPVAPMQSTASESEPASEHIRIEIPPSYSSTSLSPTLKRTTRQRSKQPASPSEDRQPEASTSPTRKRRPPRAATAMVTPSANLDSIAESIEESSAPAASEPVTKAGRKTKRSTKAVEQIEEVDEIEHPVKPPAKNARKRKATTALKGKSAKRTASQATDEVDEHPIVALNPDSYEAALTTKKPRKDKGVSKKSEGMRASKPKKGDRATTGPDDAAGGEEIDTSAQPNDAVNGAVEDQATAATSRSSQGIAAAPVLSARQRNAERRKQKAAAREAKARGQDIASVQANAGGLTVEGLEKDVPSVENGEQPMTSREAILARARAKAKTSRQQRNKEKAQAEADANGETEEDMDEQDESEDTVSRRKASTRKGTPEGSEEVTIVPSMITMSELASRNVRTGKKSEREKLMAQIDWDDVKRKRKEALEKLARNRGRRGSESESPEPAPVTNGGAEEEIDEDDIDAQIERAAAKGSRRQKGVQMKEVNGEHFIDETTLIIDRHAMANEDMEELEEVEEDDLTKHFNSQTYQCLRRKEPAERVRNWDRWTTELTDKFYDYLSQFGTDFMIISHLFPGRTRREIKAKFVREERLDPDRVKVALSGSLIAAPDTWNLDEYRQAAGLEPHQMRDPAELEASLAARRKEREAEIEEAKKVQAEIARQKKLAGAESSDEDGEPKKKKEKKKRAKKAKPSGGEAEVMEEYDED